MFSIGLCFAFFLDSVPFLLFLYSVSHLLTSYRGSFMLCLKSGSPEINLWTSFAPKIRGWSCCWFLSFISRQSWFLIYRFFMTGMVHWWVTLGNVMFFYQSRTLSTVCTRVKLVKVTPVCYYWPFQGGVSVVIYYRCHCFFSLSLSLSFCLSTTLC